MTYSNTLPTDVQISPDGTFRTGQDTDVYRLKYESSNKTFWFSCAIEFDPKDGNAYKVTVERIGIRERMGVGQILFNQEEHRLVRQNIHTYLVGNGVFESIDPCSLGRVTQVILE
jgi:hypothetical protein